MKYIYFKFLLLFTMLISISTYSITSEEKALFPENHDKVVFRLCTIINQNPPSPKDCTFFVEQIEKYPCLLVIKCHGYPLALRIYNRSIENAIEPNLLRFTRRIWQNNYHYFHILFRDYLY